MCQTTIFYSPKLGGSNINAAQLWEDADALPHHFYINKHTKYEIKLSIVKIHIILLFSEPFLVFIYF